MASKDDLSFIHRFQKAFDLVRTGKLKGIQLRLGEKPGQTISNIKEVEVKNRFFYLALIATITGVLVISIPQLNSLPTVARVAVACGLYLAAAILLIHQRKSPAVGLRG